MDFLDKQLLYHLIWLVPVMILLCVTAALRRHKLLALILGDRAADNEYVLVSAGKRWLRLIIFITAVILLVVAASRPYWGTELLPYSGKGRDLLIALDVSKSMLAKDVQPSRFEHAKWLIQKIVNNVEEDRFGLIAFAGASFLECPLTTDKTSFFHILDDMSTETIPVGGTNIQKALEEALKAFKAAESGHRAVILITDGDELQGESVKLIAKLKEKKIPLFVVGIGDPSQPGLIRVPSEDGKGSKFLVDSKGNAVESRLNEPMLRKLAGDDGIYIRSTAMDTGLNVLLKRIKDLVPKEFESGKQTRPIERFYYPLAAGLLLLLIWIAISERKEAQKVRQSSVTGTVSLVMIAASLFISNNLNAQVVKKGGEKDTVAGALGAKDSGEKPKKKEDNPIELFNQAYEMQKSNKGDFKAKYEKAINLADKNSEIRKRAYQNIGVGLHSKARNGVAEAEKLGQQDVDKAIKKVKSSLTEYENTEDIYCEAMRQNKGNGEVTNNQQILLKDKKYAEELKTKLEELKKKLEEARKKAQKAMDKQKKQNQNQNQSQDKQKQQQQNQSQDKQQQQTPEQATKDASDASKELSNKAEEMKNKKLKDMADKAKEELDKALQAQKQNDDKKAEEHLNKAINNLGMNKNDKQKDKQNQDQKNNKDQKKQNGDSEKDHKENGKEGKQEQPHQQNQKLKDEQKPQTMDQAKQEKEIDPSQAEALLNMMTEQEDKELRKKLTSKMKNINTKDSDKNW